MAWFGLRQFEFGLLTNFVEVSLTPQKGCLSQILEHRLIGQHTRQPSEQRRPPNMPQRWMSKFSQLMAKSPLFIKLSGYSQISWLSLSD
jgi:hypothetical protein